MCGLALLAACGPRDRRGREEAALPDAALDRAVLIWIAKTLRL